MEPDQTPAPAPQKSSVLKIVVITIVVLVILGIMAMVALGFFAKKFFTSGGVSSFIEKQIEQETGKDVDININTDGQGLNIKTDEGTVQIAGNADGSVAVPEVIKNLAPVMPGATAKSAVSVNQTADQKATSWVFFASSASATDIKAYYIREMTGRGWVKESEVAQSGLSMVNFVKGEERLVLNIGVVPGANSTDSGFQLILTEK